MDSQIIEYTYMVQKEAVLDYYITKHVPECEYKEAIKMSGFYISQSSSTWVLKRYDDEISERFKIPTADNLLFTSQDKELQAHVNNYDIDNNKNLNLKSGYFLTKEIRALSFKNPYACAMFEGKTIETRSWPTKYRGLVLICATKNPYSWQNIKNISEEFTYSLINATSDKVQNNGMAIGIARLVDCRPMLREDASYAMVEYRKNLFSHVYKDAHRIKPFNWDGLQRWKILTTGEKKLIQLI